MKGTLLRANGDTEDVTDLTFNRVGQLINAYLHVEVVHCPGGLVLFVHDEAPMIGLPYNSAASMVAQTTIKGDAILTSSMAATAILSDEGE